MENPLRVLQINIGSKNFGGVSSFLFEIYKNIDRSKIQFDFLSPQLTTYGLYREEIEKMGANIYELEIYGNIVTRKIKLFIKLVDFLKKNKYKIVHINSGSFFMNLEIAIIARVSGIKTIIVHSHNSKEQKVTFKNMLISILKPCLSIIATDYFACSNKAAADMFSEKIIKNEKVKIISNGIEIEKFKFNEEVRKKYRKELKIEDKFVIGHIGRFEYQKNHKLIVEVFKEVYNKNKNCVLLLIGEGTLEEEIRYRIKELKLDNSVIFLGQQKDIPGLLQAMDVFLFPSFFEGLGIVLIEAQASGLPCIVSDKIPEEAFITELVQSLSIKENPVIWAEKLLSTKDNDYRNKWHIEEVNSVYNINLVSREIEEFYLEKEKNI